MILVPLKQIKPNPWQPRQDEDEDHIKALAENIRANRYLSEDKRGLLQIPVARLIDHHGDPLSGPQAVEQLELYQPGLPPVIKATTFFQLAFGHSRLAAFRLLETKYPSEHWDTMPLEVVFYGDLQMATAAWTENAQRKDLNPAEEAHAIHKMMTDFNWTQEKAADTLSLNRSTIANKLRLLKLPDEVLAELRRGTLSERQAIALLPMYELPSESREILDANSAYAYLRPDAIAKNAHKLTSDQLRDRVKESVALSTKSLGQTIFPLDIIIGGDPPLRPVACRDCDRALSNKTEKRCVDLACFTAKENAWKQRELNGASTMTGLPIAPPNISGRVYDTFWESTKDALQHALDTHCANLHVEWSTWVGSNAISPDFPHTRHICYYGEGGKCKCRAAIEAEAKKHQQKIDAANKARLQSEILDPAIALVVAAIWDGNLVVWRAIAQSDAVREHSRRQRLEKAKDVHQIAAVIALELLTNRIWYNLHENLERAQKDITDNLKKLGLAPSDT